MTVIFYVLESMVNVYLKSKLKWIAVWVLIFWYYIEVKLFYTVLK